MERFDANVLEILKNSLDQREAESSRLLRQTRIQILPPVGCRWLRDAGLKGTAASQTIGTTALGKNAVVELEDLSEVQVPH